MCPTSLWPHSEVRPAKDEHDQEIRNCREAIARSLRLLRQNEPPDTFLGRRTQVPFPLEGWYEAVQLPF
jgi:hypothetical protein